MNYTEFLLEVETSKASLARSDRAEHPRTHLLTNEALFQLPFLAMVILTLAKGTRKPSLTQLGQLVGECIEDSIPGFKRSPQQIGWSANLRIRTIKALTFLEVSGLARISTGERTVVATEKGRQVYDAVMTTDGALAGTLVAVERSYRNLAAEAQIRLEV